MAKRGNWRGCPNIVMVYHNDWADPDLVYDGYTFNYWDIENALWDMFLEDTGHSDNESGDPAVEKEFDAYVCENAPAYLDDVIAGGYFEDGKKTWHNESVETSAKPNLAESYLTDRPARRKKSMKEATTVTTHRNKRNPHKYMEVHHDGYGHRSARQYMQWKKGEEIDFGDDYPKVIQKDDVKNFTGDGRLHRMRNPWYKEVVETDYDLIDEGLSDSPNVDVYHVDEVIAGMTDNVDDDTIDSTLKILNKAKRALRTNEQNMVIVIASSGDIWLDDKQYIDGRKDLYKADGGAVLGEDVNGTTWLYFKNEDEAERWYADYKSRNDLDESCGGKKKPAKKSDKKHLMSENKNRKAHKRSLKESRQDKNVIWSSDATEDWIWGLSEEEKRAELESTGYFDGYTPEEIAEFDDDDLYAILMELYGEQDYDDLVENIAPAIAQQCYGDHLWLVGNYQRWDGGREAMGYFKDAEEGIKDVCYPNYDSTATLYDEDGHVVFTESSHDAPTGGTAMTLFSFKTREDFDKADNEEDGWGVSYDAEDFAAVKSWIEKGWLTPVDADRLFSRSGLDESCGSKKQLMSESKDVTAPKTARKILYTTGNTRGDEVFLVKTNAPKKFLRDLLDKTNQIMTTQAKTGNWDDSEVPDWAQECEQHGYYMDFLDSGSVIDVHNGVWDEHPEVREIYEVDW